MSPERWKKLEEICHAAWTLKPSERRAFLDQACAGDEELRREAESLLAADGAAADDFLQSGALTLGMQALAEQETRRDDMNAATTEVFEIDISIGMILDGRYEILAALDAGGMGEVYKARDRRLNRLVVVKVLKKKSQKNPWTVRKFRAEGEAQSRIQHPNVATVLDTGALPSGEQYLVMEFIDGQTLRQIIKDRQLALPEAAEIIKQTGRAVAAIHNARLIHRDLKPENIMVYHEAETGEFVVKVIDFGIVRDLDKSTVVGQIIGTPLYMSPEQLDGKEATTADDVYALGEIAYEMLTGNHPFKPEDLAHLLKLKQEEVKVKPSALRPGLPQAAEDLILAALSPKANKRQSSARAFGDDLTRELTPSPSPPRNKFDWRIVAAAAVVLVAVISGLLWWSLSDQALPPAEVVVVRPASQPASGAIAAPANPRIYDAEASFPTGKPPQGMVYATIGFTVWRTRPATARDSEEVARETIDSQEMASERIADSISDGERIYLGIESLTSELLPDKGGYLYVVNREQYADGSFGRARLIFPTLLTYEGKNRVKPGQPIVLPDTNRPFIIKRSSTAQVAEIYTIILSPWEFWLPEPLSNKAMVLPDNLVADWEKQYGERMYRATLRGGVGQTRTKREQAVGIRATIDTAESLTQDEPLPQTCYRGAVKIGSPAMVTVALRLKD